MQFPLVYLVWAKKPCCLSTETSCLFKFCFPLFGEGVPFNLIRLCQHLLCDLLVLLIQSLCFLPCASEYHPDRRCLPTTSEAQICSWSLRRHCFLLINGKAWSRHRSLTLTSRGTCRALASLLVLQRRTSDRTRISGSEQGKGGHTEWMARLKWERWTSGGRNTRSSEYWLEGELKRFYLSEEDFIPASLEFFLFHVAFCGELETSLLSIYTSVLLSVRIKGQESSWKWV